MAEESATKIVDLEIQDFVTEAIKDLVIVRESHPPLQVTVENGIVALEGVVLSNIIHSRVLHKAATTPGVQRVVDRLYEDSQLELAVTKGLAADATLKQAQPSVRVSSYRGDTTLAGTVRNDIERSGAEK